MAQLETLANELFEEIVTFLDFDSICNLRLVSRQCAVKTAQQTYRSFFQSWRVTLTVKSLENFRQAVSGPLGQCVRDLTLVGLVYDLDSARAKVIFHDQLRFPSSLPGPSYRLASKNTKAARLRKINVENLRRQQEEWISAQEEGIPLRLLREAFNHIGNHQHTLRILSFEVQQVKDPLKAPKRVREAWSYHILEEGSPIRAAASETFDLGLRSLRESRLDRAEALDIYASSLVYSLSPDALREMSGDMSWITRPILPVRRKVPTRDAPVRSFITDWRRRMVDLLPERY